MYSFYTKPAFWIGNMQEMMEVLGDKHYDSSIYKKPSIIREYDFLQILVYKDGLLGINFKANIEENLKSTLGLLEYFNGLSFSIYNSINMGVVGNKCSLNPYNINVDDYLDVGEESIGFGNGTSYSTKIFKDRYKGLYGIQRTLFFTIEEVSILLNEFDEVIKKEKVWLFSYFNRIISNFKEQNFFESFIDAFFIIEVMLNKLWNDYLASNKDKLTKERKALLTGRDMTLAMKTNILHLNNIISTNLLDKIDNLRKRRNKIVHDIELMAKSGELYSDDFENVFIVINELALLAEKIDVKFCGGYSFRTFRN